MCEEGLTKEYIHLKLKQQGFVLALDVKVCIYKECLVGGAYFQLHLFVEEMENFSSFQIRVHPTTSYHSPTREQ